MVHYTEKKLLFSMKLKLTSGNNLRNISHISLCSIPFHSLIHNFHICSSCRLWYRYPHTLLLCIWTIIHNIFLLPNNRKYFSGHKLTAQLRSSPFDKHTLLTTCMYISSNSCTITFAITTTFTRTSFSEAILIVRFIFDLKKIIPPNTIQRSV